MVDDEHPRRIRAAQRDGVTERGARGPEDVTNAREARLETLRGGEVQCVLDDTTASEARRRVDAEVASLGIDDQCRFDGMFDSE